MRVIRKLGLKVIDREVDSAAKLSNFGTLTAVRGDAVDAIRQEASRSDSDLGGQYSTTVVTANYSFHRLPTAAKADLLRMLRGLGNIIFVVGDLAQNTSPVNRRYFNLGVNGPLNPGNQRLNDLMRAWKYSVVDINKQVPASLDSRLAKAIREAGANDGHLWIAYHGRIAEDALALEPVLGAIRPAALLA